MALLNSLTTLSSLPLLPSRKLSSISKSFTRSITIPKISTISIGSPGHRNLSVQATDSSSRSALEHSVNKTISQNPVVVYSKTWCSYSSEVKSLFKKLGVEPSVIELDEMGQQGQELQKALERLTGQHTVPNVFIGGQHIGGCTDTVALYMKGELEPLLSEANAKKTES